MQKTLIKLVLVTIGLSAANAAFAQEEYGFSRKVGESDFYPAVRLEYVSSSNVFLSSDNETESSDVRVTPQFLFIADKGQFSLEAEYKGDYNNSDVSVASYADHALRFESKAELSGRLRAGARLSFLKKHQVLGTDFTRAIADENTDAVEYNQTGLRVFGNYGATQARGNVEFGIDIDAVDFTNQSALTDGESYSGIEPYGIFSLRVSPELRALAELRIGSTSYDNSLKDRSDTTVLLGVDIAPTRKFNGQIKVGSTLTNYDSDLIEDATELVIRGRLRYAPVSYSNFALNVNRDTDKFSDNAATNNEASVTDVIQLTWTHNWSSRFFHRASLFRSAKTQECPSQDVVTNLASYELNLKFRRWLEFGVGGSGGNREAEACDGIITPNSDYDLTQVGVHIRATL